MTLKLNSLACHSDSPATSSPRYSSTSPSLWKQSRYCWSTCLSRPSQVHCAEESLDPFQLKTWLWTRSIKWKFSKSKSRQGHVENDPTQGVGGVNSPRPRKWVVSTAPCRRGWVVSTAPVPGGGWHQQPRLREWVASTADRFLQKEHCNKHSRLPQRD